MIQGITASFTTWPDFFRSVADFIIIAGLIYYIMCFLRGTRGANILIAIVSITCVATLLVEEAELKTLKYLLSGFGTILGTAIVVIFQPELRRALAQAGALFARREIAMETIDEVVEAAIQMSERKTGALIVFEKNIGLASIVNAAIGLDAKVNSALLQTIFFHNSPLHDCAVIIRKNRIVAAHAVLPLTQEDAYNPAHCPDLGTRHRAAIGITEESDAVALVVSEETGIISISNRGRLLRDFSREDLLEQLNFLLIKRGSDTVFPRAHELQKKVTDRQLDLFSDDDFGQGDGK